VLFAFAARRRTFEDSLRDFSGHDLRLVDSFTDAEVDGNAGERVVKFQ
jgi:hypothetical protein